jgi:ketosteroid isomerase-like protein
MTELLQDRAARNQALFREYNERLEAMKPTRGGRDRSLTDWVCECADTSCSVPLRLTLEEYESVRTDPTHFLVAPSDDHVVGDVERIVERRDRYWVVEKVGRAAEVSEEFEPRSRNDSGSEGPDIESLARRYFALFNARDLDELRALLHPDVVLELRAVQPGAVLRGREEVVRFFENEFPHRLWETVVQACKPLTETGVVVAGRIRWMDEERVLRDDPRLWALEFRDGLLLRSVPVHSVSEAQSILASSGSAA